jgi:hypothetical protein
LHSIKAKTFIEIIDSPIAHQKNMIIFAHYLKKQTKENVNYFNKRERIN